jgi:hypothetical protein
MEYETNKEFENIFKKRKFCQLTQSLCDKSSDADDVTALLVVQLQLFKR